MMILKMLYKLHGIEVKLNRLSYSGSKVLEIAAEIMISPESVPVDSVRWRCVVSSDQLIKSSVQSNCMLDSSTFFRILKV
jgi:hypothetical protein